MSGYIATITWEYDILQTKEHEGHDGKFFDLPLIDGRLKTEVELLQGALVWEVSQIRPGA